MESVEQPIYWLMFIVGLCSFGGFIIVAYKLTQATPMAIEKLTSRIEELLLEQETDSKARNLLLHDLKVTVDKCDKAMEHLEYMHKHADQFGFGTKAVKSQLGAMHDNLLRITVHLESKGSI